MAENSYQVNGLNLTNFRNGLGSSFVPFEFMEEVQVKTGGYEAEFGRATGGVINMVTKSGSNTLPRRRSTPTTSPSSLQEMTDNNYLYPNQAGESEELEANASLGGPIFKDKLFYFAFVDYTDRSDWWMTTTAADPRRERDPVLRRQARLEHHPQPPPRGDLLHRRDHRRHHASRTTNDDRHLRRRRSAPASGRPRRRELHRQVHRHPSRQLPGRAAVRQERLRPHRPRRATTSAPYAYDGRQRRPDSQSAAGSTPRPARPPTSARRSAVDADWFLGNHSLRAGIDDETNTSADITFLLGRRVLPLLQQRQPLPRASGGRGGRPRAPLRVGRRVRDPDQRHLRPGQLGARLRT